MKRYLTDFLPKVLDKKIVLIAGPRQSGKTTLSRSLFPLSEYLNYDDDVHREHILKRYWRRDLDCIIFDELHKMKEWKKWIKGIYDTQGPRPRLLVTGSAHMESFSHVGDSLAGRYFQFRLYPIDVKEGVTYWKNNPEEVTERLLNFGGFPEPFLTGDIDFYRMWQKTHLDVILRQDFLDLYSVRSLKNIELLLHLLLPRVSSTVSFSNLAGDLQVDHNSVKNWLLALENIYAFFRITPYHKNIARSLLKEPKFYFYDIGRVKDFGARIENLTALCLIKQLHYLEDTKGLSCSLHFLRTKDGQEIDFLVVIEEQPVLCIEVKTADASVSKSFGLFKKYMPNVKMVQLVYKIDHEYDTPSGVEVRRLSTFLATLDLLKYSNHSDLMQGS